MGSCSNENNNSQLDIANMMDPTSSYLLIPTSNDATINSLANISATDDPFVGGPSYFAVTATTPTTTNQYDHHQHHNHNHNHHNHHHHNHQLHQLPTSSLVVNRCELDDDDDIILGTSDLGSDSYTPGVPDGLFSSLVNSTDSGFEQFSFSDLLDVGNSPPKQLATSRTTEKRSVLMNLLVYGSDIDAGYVC